MILDLSVVKSQFIFSSICIWISQQCQIAIDSIVSVAFKFLLSISALMTPHGAGPYYARRR